MRTAPARKPREAPPPAPYLRSPNGVPARLKRTSRTTIDGRWLYRLDYGNVIGTQEWTLEQLVAMPGVRWMQRRPKDLNEPEQP